MAATLLPFLSFPPRPNTRIYSPHVSFRPSACLSAAGSSSSRPDVVVTREQGKNAKLIAALAGCNVSCLEVPLIKHTHGPDLHRLPSLMRESEFDWIVISSPEAASVFIDAWKVAGCPTVQLGVVGAGTAGVFSKLATRADSTINVAFSPSKATGKVLASELPKTTAQPCTVLYPASVKAGNDIEEGLTERGFVVTRLNTYNTVAVEDVDEMILRKAISAPVVAVASPSAVRAWLTVTSKFGNWDNSVACIGETTAVAAKRLGLKKVYYPENPGLEGWVDSILEALQIHSQVKSH